MIPLFKVFMSVDVNDPVRLVLHSGYIGQGPQVQRFEELLGSRFRNPRVLTLSAGTHGLHLALRLAGVGPGDEVICTPLTCVSYSTAIKTSDGHVSRYLPIGKIVNQKMPVLVESFNERTGEVELKKVINWMKFPSKDDWYVLAIRSGYITNSGKFRKRHVWVTGDHKVLTDQGYKRVDEIARNPQLRVATDHAAPNPRQMEFITGTLLGNGSIQTTNGAGRLVFTHGVDQIEWVTFKEKALAGFAPVVTERTRRYRLRTKSSFFFWKLRNLWYSSNQENCDLKKVPEIELTPLSLATWLMDDGCLSSDGTYIFRTDDFSAEHIWRLFYKLVDMGLRPTVRRDGNRPGFRICIGNGSVDRHDSASKLARLVSPYIIPSMRHKLPDDPTLPPFDPCLWDLGAAEPYYAEVVVEPGIPPKHEKPSHVYCIEVEDNHNFITKNMVLSNCTASNWPVMMQGADIVWADVREDCNIDPKSVESKITPKTKAILCVHWGGYPCDLAELHSVAEKHGLVLVEDAAHAYGSSYRDSVIGDCRYSDFVMMSFQAIKHLTTVDGGALFCRREGDYRRGKLLRWYGIDRETPRTDFRCELPIAEWGYKYHMNDVCATIGIYNMAQVEHNISVARSNAEYYNQELNGVSGVRVIQTEQDRKSSYWLYTLLVERRSEFCYMMGSRGVSVSRVHERNDKHPCTERFRADLPNLEKIVQQMICIPVGWWVTREQREFIVECIKGGW